MPHHLLNPSKVGGAVDPFALSNIPPTSGLVRCHPIFGFHVSSQRAPNVAWGFCGMETPHTRFPLVPFRINLITKLSMFHYPRGRKWGLKIQHHAYIYATKLIFDVFKNIWCYSGMPHSSTQRITLTSQNLPKEWSYRLRYHLKILPVLCF